MAHNLSTWTDDTGTVRHACYALRENPWHRLGTTVERPIDDPEILRLAGLAWEARKAPMYTHTMTLVPDHVAVQRSDTDAILGVVGKDYTPLQNNDLLRFFRCLTDHEPLVIESAGALGAGETVWALARLPEQTIAIGDDLTASYLLISNGHAGNRQVTVLPTTIRVVCQNTLAMSDHQAKHAKQTLATGYRIRHTKSMHQALEDVAHAYRASLRHVQATREAATSLAQRPLSDALITDYMERVFHVDPDADERGRAATLRRQRENRIRGILESPTCQVRGTRSTAYSLLQAVTEYIDHERPTRCHRDRGDAHTDCQRFESAQFGSGARLKARAWSSIFDAVATHT